MLRVRLQQTIRQAARQVVTHPAVRHPAHSAVARAIRPAAIVAERRAQAAVIAVEAHALRAATAAVHPIRVVATAVAEDVRELPHVANDC